MVKNNTLKMCHRHVTISFQIMQPVHNVILNVRLLCCPAHWQKNKPSENVFSSKWQFIKWTNIIKIHVDLFHSLSNNGLSSLGSDDEAIWTSIKFVVHLNHPLENVGPTHHLMVSIPKEKHTIGEHDCVLWWVNKFSKLFVLPHLVLFPLRFYLLGD